MPNHHLRSNSTYPGHFEISQYTPALPALNTTVPYLRAAGIAVHLRELKLCLGARAGREREVADYVAKGLSMYQKSSANHLQMQSLNRGLPLPSRFEGRGWQRGGFELGELTVQARARRRLSAWCGRGLL